MMFKKIKETAAKTIKLHSKALSAVEGVQKEHLRDDLIRFIRDHLLAIVSTAVMFLFCLGVMASNGWLPHTDGLTGKKSGWFGKDLSYGTANIWNPFVLPTPSPTPQLAKEYIYAGSRLLAVEDANASSTAVADLAVWRPKTGVWYILEDGQIETPVTFGQDGDVPVQGDFDGDGLTDFSVFRPGDSKTYITRSSDKSSYDVTLGAVNDLPAVGDFDGDGKTDVTLWRPSTYVWSFRLSASDTTITAQYGANNDKPLAGDFDGDGVSDKAYWRSSDHTFHSVNSSDDEAQTVSMGASGNVPVCGDYDGDGKTDFALLAGNVWIIRSSSNGAISNTTWQTAGDIAVHNDYDGDGKVDIAVWHPVSGVTETAYWYIRQSSDFTTRTEELGQPGDIPVPALYRR
jgi:hypothetical protein